MNILVTGGAGFIGSNFILYWIKNNPEDKIVNFDKLTYAGNLENLKDIENHPNYKFIKGDILSPSDVKNALKDIDVIVHFAAESHVDRSILKPSDFVTTNVVGTQILLDGALENKVKLFHHVSTDEVFGSVELNYNKKFDENTGYNPRSPYSASKAGSDHLVRSYSATYNLPITITNCSNNYGPFQFPEKLIPLAITNLLEDKKVPVYGDGQNIRDWLYVEDHVRAIELVIKKGTVGQTYMVGGMNEDITNLEIVKKIITYLNKDETYIDFVKDRPGHDRKYSVDWTRINRDLGWRPQYDFDSWLIKTIDWYKENKSWWQNIKSGEYKKYYELQYGAK